MDPTWYIDEDIPSIHSSSNETPLDISGPITRSRAKQLEKEIHSQVNANLMFNNQFMLNDPILLSSCFNVLRNDGGYEPAWDEDGFKPLDIWTKKPIVCINKMVVHYFCMRRQPEARWLTHGTNSKHHHGQNTRSYVAFYRWMKASLSLCCSPSNGSLFRLPNKEVCSF